MPPGTRSAATVCVLLTFARAVVAADASALFADGGAALRLPRLLTRALQSIYGGARGPFGRPYIDYNIGVADISLAPPRCGRSDLRGYVAEFPVSARKQHHGLALRAQGDPAEARVAFEWARGSGDDKIVALANAQLGSAGPARTAAGNPPSGWFSCGRVRATSRC